MVSSRKRKIPDLPEGGAELIKKPVRGAFKSGKGGLKKADAPKVKKRKRPPRKSVADDPYQRPKVNKSTKKKIWEDAKNKDGKVFDPLTGKEIREGEAWDAGHRPGWEFRKHQAEAEAASTPRSEFVQEYQDPSHYRPELPASNQGHADEAPDSVNHWRDFYQRKKGGT